MWNGSSDDDSEDDGFYRIPNRPRNYRNREDFLETLNESEFLRRFRLSKRAFLMLLAEIEPQITPKTKR